MRSGSAEGASNAGAAGFPAASASAAASADSRRRPLVALLPWLVFFILIAASWNRWMEPFIDTGRELMVARRVAQGQRLYRDIHFHHGPLAPYAGAVVETIAGSSFAARTALAFALAAAAVEALRRLARRWLPGAPGALAASLAVALPFFLRPGGWMCPFSVDTSIAVAALLGALVFLLDPERAGGRALAAAALCLAAALLSRPELGLAGIAAAALDLRRWPRRLIGVTGVPLAAAAAGYTAVSAGVPVHRLISDGWLAVLRPPQAFRNVYLAFAGLDRPALRTAELALAAVLLLLTACLLALGAVGSQRLRGASPAAARGAAVAVLLVLAGCAFAFQFPPESWRGALGLFPPVVRVVPIVCALALLVRLAGMALARRKGDWVPPVSDGALLIATFFGTRLLLAAGGAGPYNAYFLPLPILVACVAASRLADKYKGEASLGPALPGLVQGALAILLVASMAGLAAGYRASGWERLETPAGPIVLPSVEARTAQLALADLSRRVPRGGTLAGFPEAGFFNYVLQARNPLPLEQFWPGHLDDAGEDLTARQLEARPPDVIVMINALAVGEGFRAFGQDYSRHLGDFLSGWSRPVATFGPAPTPEARIGDPQFFIQVRVPDSPAGSGRGAGSGPAPGSGR